MTLRAILLLGAGAVLLSLPMAAPRPNRGRRSFPPADVTRTPRPADVTRTPRPADASGSPLPGRFQRRPQEGRRNTTWPAGLSRPTGRPHPWGWGSGGTHPPRPSGQPGERGRSRTRPPPTPLTSQPSSELQDPERKRRAAKRKTGGERYGARPTGTPLTKTPKQGKAGKKAKGDRSFAPAMNVTDLVTAAWQELVSRVRPAGRGFRTGGNGTDVVVQVPVKFMGLSSESLRAAVLSASCGKRGKTSGAVLYDFSQEPASVVIRGPNACLVWLSAPVTVYALASAMVERNGTVNATFARTNVTLNVTGPMTSEGAAGQLSNVTALFCGRSPIYNTQVVDNEADPTPAPGGSTASTPVARERRKVAWTLHERVTIRGLP